jgi:hypothetical protein
MIKKQINNKGINKVWYPKSILTFGKYKGMTIKEVLEDKDTRSYVTEFMIKQLQMQVEGIENIKIKKDSCYGIDLWKGLTRNHVFYKDYIKSTLPSKGVRIACKMTGVIVEGNSLPETEDKLNLILDELYTSV